MKNKRVKRKRVKRKRVKRKRVKRKRMKRNIVKKKRLEKKKAKKTRIKKAKPKPYLFKKLKYNKSSSIIFSPPPHLNLYTPPPFSSLPMFKYKNRQHNSDHNKETCDALDWAS